ncbi:glycosyltransferase [Microbispora cellulosiformans]|uniref:Glycosyltransferase n=1 Tax=Microbispora cellulosiformans TaxID=2614688 RepID=A0A5J5KBW7_9ACTN|nr:glycosyltransferase [Microbispora cellulosiformans]KAA9381469.1 glycosyltransferase [Microbispora cellulosiformans]
MPPPKGSPVLEIVIPARNEEARIAKGLSELCAKLAELPFPARIVVVDNASTDATPDVVRALPPRTTPIRLIRCETRGKGAAVRAGLLATTAPLVGFCDVDMATDLAALDTVVRRLVAGQPAVIGSRAAPGSVVEARHSRVRRLGARVFRALARRVTGPIGDTQCGFKFFHGDLARRAARRLRTTGFAFDVELLAHVHLLGAGVQEIPVTWRDVGGSTFSCWRHSWGVFLQIAVIWVRTRSGRRAARPRLALASTRPFAEPLSPDHTAFEHTAFDHTPPVTA